MVIALACLLFLLPAGRAGDGHTGPVNIPQPAIPLLFSGTPFFPDTYHYADLVLQRGRRMKNVQARVNLYTKEVQFIANGVEAVLGPGTVSEVSFSDTAADKQVTFYRLKTGYPAVDGRSGNDFYIVLAAGKASVLRLIEKKGTERRDAATNQLFIDYTDTDYFYFFNNGEMKRLKRDRDFLLHELADKQTQLSEYIETHKLRFGNIEQVISLVNFYNSL